MYHHFCDFFNLYVSLHLNATSKYMFSKDVNILIWETYNYLSNFEITWSAFTKNPLWNLRSFQGKRVCFRKVMFPLLPRMIFGLYYNTPIVWGCQESGLFHAFSKFILHRLKIPKRQISDQSAVRVTLLSRDTQYRRILNEKDLLEALKSSPRGYVVNQVKIPSSKPTLNMLFLWLFLLFPGGIYSRNGFPVSVASDARDGHIDWDARSWAYSPTLFTWLGRRLWIVITILINFFNNFY